MVNKIKRFVNMNLDILYAMSANLAGGALLAKVFQLIDDIYAVQLRDGEVIFADNKDVDLMERYSAKRGFGY